MRGRSQWLSSGQPMHYEMCQSIAHILSSDDKVEGLSARSQGLLEELQEEFGWLEEGKTSVLIDTDGNANWWTFSGRLLNAAFSEMLATEADKITSDNLCITFSHIYDEESLVTKIKSLMTGAAEEISLSLDEDFIQKLKFSECLSQLEIDKEILARYALGRDFIRFSKKPISVLHLAEE